MPKYINFDALGVQSCNPDVFVNKGYAEGWNNLMRILYNAPAADVAEVRHGRWEEIDDDYAYAENVYRCSVCGEEWDILEGTPEQNMYYYCPSCGAKMDGETKEEADVKL